MKKIIAANWKMNLTGRDAEPYVETLLREIGTSSSVDVVIVPPFTVLPAISEVIGRQSSISLGAQNMHWENSGAYTGEISASMLKEWFVHWVVLGHSERRQYFGETDDIVNKKVLAAYRALIKPIVCIGETLEERDGGRVEEILERQIKGAFVSVTEDQMADTVIAYEPVWAIGTGRTASPEQAQDAHAFIRKTLSSLYNDETALRVRIQYGGSVKPDNTKELMSQPDVDGALVGGASLDARTFSKIINLTAELDK